MIGYIGGKIGIGAVGLQKRPIDIVAVGGGAKQRLLAILIVLDRRSLGRRQAALVDVTFGTEKIDRFSDTIVSGLDQRPLREEDVVRDVERREIALDPLHYHRDRLAPRDTQP